MPSGVIHDRITFWGLPFHRPPKSWTLDKKKLVEVKIEDKKYRQYS
jgi:uncharacterized metal-binding protein